jgi:PAS domain S-box-containing protein
MPGGKPQHGTAEGPRPSWLAEAIDQAADLIFATDARDRFAYVSRRAEDLLGVAPAGLVGELVVSVVEPSGHALVLDALRSARLGDSSQAQVFECRFLTRRAPQPVPLEVTLRPVVAKGETVGCIGVARSLTQRGENLAQRLASERVAAIGDLANQAADRINNPLAVLVTHVGVIERAAQDGRPADPQSIEQMRNAIGRVADVTEELATIADTSIQKLLLGRSLADISAGPETVSGEAQAPPGQ